VLLVVVYVLVGIGNLVGSAGAANALMKARAVLAWSAPWPHSTSARQSSSTT
jgi:hypothetical protein